MVYFQARWTGVSSFDVSLDKQEVTVEATIPYDDVLEKIKKTGKEVCCNTYLSLMNMKY